MQDDRTVTVNRHQTGPEDLLSDRHQQRVPCRVRQSNSKGFIGMRGDSLIRSERNDARDNSGLGTNRS